MSADKADRLLAEVDEAVDDRELVDRLWGTVLDPKLDEQTRDAFLRRAYDAGLVERMYAARDRYIESLEGAVRADHERRMREFENQLARDLGVSTDG